jgi:hypothetical protein
LEMPMKPTFLLAAGVSSSSSGHPSSSRGCKVWKDQMSFNYTSPRAIGQTFKCSTVLTYTCTLSHWFEKTT